MTVVLFERTLVAGACLGPQVDGRKVVAHLHGGLLIRCTSTADLVRASSQQTLQGLRKSLALARFQARARGSQEARGSVHSFRAARSPSRPSPRRFW